MPFNAKDLRDAIYASDLETVRTIVAERDAQIGFNHMLVGGGRYHTALVVALLLPNQFQQANVDIFLTLLNARDAQGNPLVDLNKKDDSGATLVSELVANYNKYKPFVLELLQSVLDARDPQGELRVNLLTDEYAKPILIRAVEQTNNVHIVNMLLDVRYADGSRVLNVNDIGFGGTALNYAKKNKPVNLQLITALEAAGGVTFQDIPLEKRYAQRKKHPLQKQPMEYKARPLPARGGEPDPAPARIPPRQREERPVLQGLVQVPKDEKEASQVVERFDRDRQNTHDIMVTRSVGESLKRLDKMYPDLNVTEELRLMSTFLEGFDYTDPRLTPDLKITLKELIPAQKKESALAHLAHLKIHDLHSYTTFTIGKICALVFRGIRDDSFVTLTSDLKANSSSTESISPDLLRVKNLSFIEKFIEAYHMYAYSGSGDICVGGGVNKIVEALNKSHSCVNIVFGTGNVKADASESMISIATDLLRAKAIAEQRKILAHWDDEEESKEKENFLQYAKVEVKKYLRRTFGVALSDADIAGMVESLPSLNKPIVHEPLFRLTKEIVELEKRELTGVTAPNPRILAIIRLVALKNISLSENNHRSFDQEYSELNKVYQTFIERDKLLKDVVQVIYNLTEPQKNSFRDQAIEALKIAAKDAYQENFDTRSFIEKYEAFMRLDRETVAIRSMPKDEDNPPRFTAIVALQMKTDELYSEDKKPLEFKAHDAFNRFRQLDRVIQKIPKNSDTQSIGEEAYTAYWDNDLSIQEAELALLKTAKSVRDKLIKKQNSGGGLGFFNSTPLDKTIAQVENAIAEVLLNQEFELSNKDLVAVESRYQASKGALSWWFGSNTNKDLFSMALCHAKNKEQKQKLIVHFIRENLNDPYAKELMNNILEKMESRRSWGQVC